MRSHQAVNRLSAHHRDARSSAGHCNRPSHTVIGRTSRCNRMSTSSSAWTLRSLRRACHGQAGGSDAEQSSKPCQLGRRQPRCNDRCHLRDEIERNGLDVGHALVAEAIESESPTVTHDAADAACGRCGDNFCNPRCGETPTSCPRDCGGQTSRMDDASTSGNLMCGEAPRVAASAAKGSDTRHPGDDVTRLGDRGHRRGVIRNSTSALPEVRCVDESLICCSRERALAPGERARSHDAAAAHTRFGIRQSSIA